MNYVKENDSRRTIPGIRISRLLRGARIFSYNGGQKKLNYQNLLNKMEKNK